MTLLHVLLLILLCCTGGLALVCGALGRRRRIRHGKPPASTLVEPDLGPGSQISSGQRRKALRVVRRGTAADDPETARVARMIARQTLHQFGNPWYRAVTPLMLLYQGLLFGGLASNSEADPTRIGFTFLALGLAVSAAYQPFHRTRYLNRVRRSLELNEGLAEAPSVKTEEQER